MLVAMRFSLLHSVQDTFTVYFYEEVALKTLAKSKTEE